MKSKSYRQRCSLALALDIVGERWTMLILRDLLAGPARFRDLQDGLPGIASNLLTRRLRDLEEAGVVERTELPPPAKVPVYQLTEIGRKIEPALVTMATWGMQFMRPEQAFHVPSARLTQLSAKLFLGPHVEPDTNVVIELRLADGTVTMTIADGEIETSMGAPAKPDVIFETKEDGLAEIIALAVAPEGVEPPNGIQRAEVSGDPTAIDEVLAVLRRAFLSLPGFQAAG